MLRLAGILAGLLGTLGTGACYGPEFAACAVTCNQGDECPSGLTCSSGFCVAPGSQGSQCQVGAVDGSPGDAEPSGPLPGMIRIETGTYTMGCVSVLCESDETAHQVTVSTFDVDQWETTQAEYNECVTSGPCIAPEQDSGEVQTVWDPETLPTTPVHGVNWSMANTYCLWRGKRLLTEAEWERAARGDDGRPYPWGANPPACNLAKYSGCGAEHPEPIQTYAAGASPFGVEDMAGNVFEWVSDRYDADYYSVSPPVDPTGPDSGTLRVIRGAGYKTGAAETNLRAMERFGRDPALAAVTYGIRCGLTPP